MSKGRVEAYLRGAMIAALTAVCAQVMIPLGAVPVNLALVPLLMGAALLPGRYALVPACLYALMGMIGLPVFAGFAGGIGVLMGPTGGYIIGYIPCVWVAAALLGRSRTFLRRCLAMGCGAAACYLLGAGWMLLGRFVPPENVLLVGVLPFVPGDVLKILLAADLSARMEGVLARKR